MSAASLPPPAAAAFSKDQLLKSSRNIVYNQRVLGTAENYDEWQKDAESAVNTLFLTLYHVRSIFQSQHSTAANQTVDDSVFWHITESAYNLNNVLITHFIVILTG